MSLTKKIIAVVFFMAMALFPAWFFLGGVGCSALKIGKENAVKGVTVTGTVKTTEDVEITVTITGIIEELIVVAGDSVEQNQVLARLDRSKFNKEVAAARSKLETARITLRKNEFDLEDARLDEERYEKLFELGAVSKRELEERTLKRQRLKELLSENEKQIKTVEANLGAIEAVIKNYVVRAPISGIITDQFVSTGDLVSPQQPLFRLIGPEDIYLGTEVEEDELDLVQEGQKAIVIFDAYPEQVFNEEVYYISKQVNPLTGTFEARITRPVENGAKILVGMTLDATIIQEELENVIIIPSEFVLEENNSAYVFKQSNSFAKKILIKTKIFDNNRVLVEEGLKEGDIILKRTDTGKLKNNTKIKIKGFTNRKSSP